MKIAAIILILKIWCLKTVIFKFGCQFTAITLSHKSDTQPLNWCSNYNWTGNVAITAQTTEGVKFSK